MPRKSKDVTDLLLTTSTPEIDLEPDTEFEGLYDGEPEPEPAKSATEAPIVFLVGQGLGAVHGFTDAWDLKQISAGEFEYQAERVGSNLTIIKRFDPYRRMSHDTQVSRVTQEIGHATRVIESLSQSVAEIEATISYDEIQKTAKDDEVYQNSVQAKIDAGYIALEGVQAELKTHTDALGANEKKLAELKAVVFPETEVFTFDLTNISLV